MSTSEDVVTPVTLEVWSDVACPWCYVGRRNLAVAMADLDDRERPEVVWRAFQLDPTIPEDGAPADAYFEARFGDDVSRIREGQERLVLLGEDLGIEFRFDRQRVVPNTHLAHRVVAAAARSGNAEPLVDELFSAYFERGIDIGDADRLHELVTDAVVDPELAAEIVGAAQEDPAVRAQVDEDLATAQALGITGVPCFVADRAIAVPGAVPPEALAGMIEEAARRRDDALDED